MTENKTISISYLNSNTWMIFSTPRSLQSLLQISRVSNWQPSSLKWQAGSVGQITYKNPANQAKKHQQKFWNTDKLTWKSRFLTFLEKPEDLATQHPHSYMATVCYGWAGATFHFIRPTLFSSLPVIALWLICYLSDSECVTIATHRGDMPSIYSLYRYMSHALSYYVL